MAFPSKPSDALFNWSPGTSPEAIEPSAGKKSTGWVKERPPFQYFNWLTWHIYTWLQYIEGTTDELKAVTTGEYDRIVGSGAGATDPNLQTAINNASAGDSILVTESATVNAVITINKADVRIKFKPGVTFTKGAAVTALQLQADSIKIHEPRFAGAYTQCILVDSGADNCRMRDAIFDSDASTHVTDNSSPNSFSEEGSIDEA